MKTGHLTIRRMIPSEVLSLIEAWMRDGKNGQLTLHFDDGWPERIAETTVRRLPRRPR